MSTRTRAAAGTQAITTRAGSFPSGTTRLPGTTTIKGGIVTVTSKATPKPGKGVPTSLSKGATIAIIVVVVLFVTAVLVFVIYHRRKQQRAASRRAAAAVEAGVSEPEKGDASGDSPSPTLSGKDTGPGFREGYQPVYIDHAGAYPHPTYSPAPVPEPALPSPYEQQTPATQPREFVAISPTIDAQKETHLPGSQRNDT